MTHDEVRTLFIYETTTGTLRRVGGRKPYPFRGVGKGRRYLAFSHSDGRTYYLHQLVWLYHHGRLPTMIDHIDGNPHNNNIDNLRECTNAQNQYNSPRKVNNRSGIKGVVYHEKCSGKPWHARIVVAGRQVSLGYHETKELAAIAYAEGASRYAGVFARVDSSISSTDRAFS